MVESLIAEPDITTEIQKAIRLKEIASVAATGAWPIISLGANRKVRFFI